MAAHLGVKNSREAADWPGRYRLKLVKKKSQPPQERPVEFSAATTVFSLTKVGK